MVTIDALPDRVFTGRVRFKSVLPDQQQRWMNPDLRVYRSEIEVLADDLRARPGMSCSIEIIVEDLEDVVHVPVQAVFLDGGATVAFVQESGGHAKRPVEVGQNNGKWVEVRSGLTAGEVVLLSQPPGMSLAPAIEEQEELEEEFDPEQPRPEEGPRGRGEGPGRMRPEGTGQRNAEAAGGAQRPEVGRTGDGQRREGAWREGGQGGRGEHAAPQGAEAAASTAGEGGSAPGGAQPAGGAAPAAGEAGPRGSG
jgi:hypothetical protein